MDNRVGLLAVDPLIYPLLRSLSLLSVLCSAYRTAICFYYYITIIYIAVGLSYSAFSMIKNYVILMTCDKISR